MGERTNVRFPEIEKILYQDGKVGGAAGWTVRAAANSFMATVAASQAAGTLVVPLPGLNEGDQIVGFHLNGQIASEGNDVEVDAALYESLPVAAASTHTAVTGFSMDQLVVAENTAMTEANTQKRVSEANVKTVKRNAAYFVLLTVTTNASTDVELLSVCLHVKRAR